MEYDLVMSIGNAIDNVYNNYSEDGARRTVAKIVGECMHVSYMTILNSAREADLHMQIADLKKESDEMIKSRLKTIKEEFKKSAGRTLKAKKVDDSCDFETLTVSPFSPFRKLKFTCTYKYEVK